MICCQGQRQRLVRVRIQVPQKENISIVVNRGLVINRGATQRLDRWWPASASSWLPDLGCCGGETDDRPDLAPCHARPARGSPAPAPAAGETGARPAGDVPGPAVPQGAGDHGCAPPAQG